MRHLPWSYPRPKRPRIRRAPALGLPWSYPGARLLHNHVERLPWTYPRPTLERDSYVAGPGAYPAPTLERLPGRLPLRTRPFSPSSSSFPAVLPPPSPRAPKGPKVSQTPPAPRLPWSSPWTLAGPLEGPATWRATWAAGFGLAVQFAFSAKRIRMGIRPNRLTARRAEDDLPWSYPGARGRGRGRTTGRPRPRPARRERRPTLEPRTGLPYTSSRREGRKTHNQPKNQTQPRLTPTRPPGGGCIGEIEAKYGLPSADRNNKATLLLTGPFRTAKSSAKDLTPLVLKLQYAKYRGPLRGPRRNRLLRH